MAQVGIFTSFTPISFILGNFELLRDFKLWEQHLPCQFKWRYLIDDRLYGQNALRQVAEEFLHLLGGLEIVFLVG